MFACVGETDPTCAFDCGEAPTPEPRSSIFRRRKQCSSERFAAVETASANVAAKDQGAAASSAGWIGNKRLPGRSIPVDWVVEASTNADEKLLWRIRVDPAATRQEGGKRKTS